MTIKILFVCNRDSYKNPYVTTLADGLIRRGCDVTCSSDEFWKNATKYDVIHFQWPNLLEKKIDHNGDNLRLILSRLKEHRIPIVVTLHNLVPHYSRSASTLLAYDLVYKNADCFIHLGSPSIELLKAQVSCEEAQHIVIPHHTYDALYKMNVDKHQARRKFGIPSDAKCILCFGSFRDDEERKLIVDLSKKLKGRYYFLTPGFYRGTILRKNILKGFKVLCKTIKYSMIAWKNHLHISHRFISDDDLPTYMAVADVLLVQRLKILNSGNVSLAMLAGLPIVGPNIGNVGWMLKQTGNGCFDINHLEHLPVIIEQYVSRCDIGSANKEFAEKNLSIDEIAQKTKCVYERMIREYRH